MKKILSVLLSFCIIFSSVGAASALDIELPKSLESFTADVTDLINEYEQTVSDDVMLFSAADDESEEADDTNRLIVKSTRSIDTLNAVNSVSGYNDLHILQFANDSDCDAAFEYYSSLSYVQYVQEDGILTETAIEESDVFFEEAAIGTASQYQSDLFGYTNAKANMGSAEVTIAVVDTGVQNDHEYLEGRVFPTGFDSVYNESCYDKRGHGTHVAGIIAANTKSNVKIKPYKVIGDDGTGTDTQLYLGIQAAIEDGVDIINLSLTRKGESEVVHEAVQNAYNAGITVVAAAGNDNVNLNETFYTPACFDEVICVVNIDANKKRASTSNWRFNDTLSAPGVDILSSYVGDTYKVMSGTSMAAPFISCCVAYLLASGDYYSPDEAYNKLYESSLVGATASIHYVVPGEVINCTSTCATPVFTYASGTFSGYLNVKITCATPGATIMYHTSDMNSNTYYEYTGPIRIDESESFTALAFCKNYKTSAIASVSYTKSDTDTSMFILDENDTLIGYTGTATTVTVPGYFNGGCVREIAASAFSGNTNIQKITLNSATTTIGEGAFEGCTALTTVSGSGVTNIESKAFKDCSSLTTVTMASLLTTGDRAFSGCTALTTLKLSKLNTIGAYAFENSGISTLTATRLTTIGDGAFSGSAIKSISFTPVTTIGERAFEKCNNLTTLSLTNKITALGDYAFSGCENLASITLTGIATLGNGIFKDCKALSTITASSLTKIGYYTFSGCIALDNFDVAHLITVGNYAFFGCSAIKELKTTDFPELTTIGNYAFAESGIESLKLSVANTLGYKAFGDCAQLKGVSLPGITEFDASVLEGSVNIERLEFQKAEVFDFGDGSLADFFPNLVSFTGNTVDIIPDYFFDGCSKLSEVNVGSATHIGAYAFRGTAVKTINFGSATTFGEGAFADMPSLESVTLNLPETLDFSMFKGSTNVKFVTFNNLVSLPEDFRCKDIFPNIERFDCGKVITIPDYAFKNCSNLCYYDFFDVETIGQEAFRGTAVNKPYCPVLEFVGERAFADCTNLVNVSFSGLDDINMNVFENSEHTITEELNLNFICYEDATDIAKLNFQKFVNIQSIALNNQKHIPANAFKNLSKLNRVILGACETVGDNAFANCTSLTTITINNAKTIGNGAFSGCTGLETFKANDLISLAYDAFDGCTNLKTLDLGNLTELPVDENGKFQLVGLDNLQSLTANAIQSIPANFLKNCENLTTVSFRSAYDIGEYAFYGTKLKTYDIPYVRNIGDYAFYGTNLELFNFTRLTSIGDYAFSDCDYLQEVEISKEITVGEGAFADCDELTVFILTNTREVPVSAISGCENLVYIELIQITELPVEADGSTYVSDKPQLEEFIADYVVEVPDDYFTNNTFLQNVYMPGVERIGDRAFMNTIITELPSEDVYSVGNYAFSGTSISSAYFNCIEEIGDYAFADCKKLTKAKIYNEYGDFKMGKGVFENCTLLTRVALYKEDIELPDYTFKNCSKLNQVYNTATFVGNSVDPTLLADIKSIGDEAFYGCSVMTLDKIKINDVEHIGKNALQGISDTVTASAYILPNLLSVDENGFGDVKVYSLALENVEVLKDVPDCNYVVIGSDIKEFSCDSVETIICAYEDSVVADFCKKNALTNFKAYNSTDAFYTDVYSNIGVYTDYQLKFEPMGFNMKYDWYACNNPDRSDAVLIAQNTENPSLNVNPLFSDNNNENKYRYFYCVATSTENGNELAIQSGLHKNLFATLRGTENTFIDFSANIIYTDSLYNLNTLDNIVNVDGDILVTPSYSTEDVDCYGTGTSIIYTNGGFPWLRQNIIVYGDINGDGVVDVLDASEIERASNGNSVLEGHYESAADINSSGKIDVLDYQAAVNKALAS